MVLRHMTQDKFRAEVFRLGRLVYAIGLCDGTVTEFLAKGGPGVDGPAAEDLWTSYPAQTPGGTTYVQLCDDEFACTMGNCLTTWIGPNTDRPTRFFELISDCQQIGLDVVDGSLCIHATFSDTIADDGNGKPRTFANDYYVDAATHLLVRWDSSQQQSGREALVRHRTMQKYSTTPLPPDFAWTLTPNNLQRSMLTIPDRSQTASR